MATRTYPEAPAWAVTREQSFTKKYMDESALVPFEQLPPGQQRRQRGRWLAYTYTLDDPKRTYVYETAVNLVKAHSATKRDSSFDIADLGAGNGRNTFKTVGELRNRENSGTNGVYLVEQSGTALVDACRYFRGHRFADPLRHRSGNNGIFVPTLQLDRTTVHFQQADITDTKLPNQSMDAVTIVNVWHHLPSWDQLMASTKEIDRILKPEGMFAIIDTRPLPQDGFMRKIIERKIKEAVNFQTLLARARSERVQLDDDLAEGMKDFCSHDAFKAFENALTREQFEQTLRQSALAPSLQRTGDLRSPHLLHRFIYPPLNIAWGIKET